MKVLLITKTTNHCKEVQRIVTESSLETTIIEGESGDTFPAISWEGDYLISFLSPWILKKNILDKSKISINFHSASLSYPGSGGYNFAIYNKEKEYGVVCHHMLPKVDSGGVIKTINFPLYKTDSVYDLKERSMEHLKILFKEVWKDIIEGKSLPKSTEKWKREQPYTIKDLKGLCKITLDMESEEIDRRIKATYFPGAKNGPYLELNGKRFFYRLHNKD